MNNLDPQKLWWQGRRFSSTEEGQKSSNSYMSKPPSMPNPKKMQIFPGGFADDLMVSTVVPPVTVVLEGRSICQRISLDKHSSYQSLAMALRQMFVDNDDDDDDNNNNGFSPSSDASEVVFDLSNAIPGHLIAYEDMENDLLLVGDLKWNDFVRVAKRIRILPIKANSRKRSCEK